MENKSLQDFIKNMVENIPQDWVNLTTHRLDIYDESQAKTQFLEKFETLFTLNNVDATALKELPTAFDYIRLGHPLSCVLEWTIANMHDLKADQVISFSSKTTPIMAVLRKNLLAGKNTLIAFKDQLPDCFDVEALKQVYGYQFDLQQVESEEEIMDFDGSIVFISEKQNVCDFELGSKADFLVNTNSELGSIIITKDSAYVSEIQHVRRRETIAMTPSNTLIALKNLVGIDSDPSYKNDSKAKVSQIVKDITVANSKVTIASSGLSMQYGIVMGLIEDALENHPGKDIKIIVPPNCYGGTNDQARRVAACLDNVEVMDLPVDREHDMVQSTETVLNKIAEMDAVPFIIVEIPTNPRVEVPDMIKLKEALSKERKTKNGGVSVDPVFILDQTFCPNVHFLGDEEMLASVRTIAYVSGSKFPSGGKCTAGYAVANKKASGLMDKIEKHLKICDNEATPLQLDLLAEQMPSMIQRIADAYKNTREFVTFIEAQLPDAKINFVSEELASQTFTPSVFSLDLPTKGNTEEEKEAYKRALNLKLINKMIEEIPNESKFCVSYGQLKGCYWTIPATSTQGTTKEGDKDYIVRVALAPDLDLEKHKQVFKDFVDEL